MNKKTNRHKKKTDFYEAGHTLLLISVFFYAEFLEVTYDV